MSGTYSIDKSKINFTRDTTLLADCPDVPFETTFLQSLNEVDRYSLTDDIMTLKRGKSTLIKFRRRLQ